MLMPSNCNEVAVLTIYCPRVVAETGGEPETGNLRLTCIRIRELFWWNTFYTIYFWTALLLAPIILPLDPKIVSYTFFHKYNGDMSLSMPEKVLLSLKPASETILYPFWMFKFES